LPEALAGSFVVEAAFFLLLEEAVVECCLTSLCAPAIAGYRTLHNANPTIPVHPNRFIR
jgi:hypothetical protein